MRITLIGPGKMSIPPTSWGAVEILIWDYYTYLQKVGHEVTLINTENHEEIIELTNNSNPDFVHLHYDEYYDVLDRITCLNKAVTSHYGYLDGFSEYYKLFKLFGSNRLINKIIQRFPFVSLKLKSLSNYYPIFSKFIKGRHEIFCLSKSIENVYKRYGLVGNSKVFHNGARDDLFTYNKLAKYPDRSLYLAKIDFRKKQYLYQGIPNLYFVGNLADDRFNHNLSNYLGCWEKEYLYQHLTDYANLVLLSDGEAHALVCCEALMAGLGLVVSEYASANLDVNLPFIDVIPKHKLSDINYVSKIIENNRLKSIRNREEIRQYGVNNFSWRKIVGNYVNYIQQKCDIK